MGRNPKQECLTLYPEIADISKKLSDKQLGTLIRALINYRFEGTVTDFPKSSTLGLLFPIMKNQVDRMEQVKKRNAENARIRWEKAAAAQNPETEQTDLYEDMPAIYE